MDFMRKITRKKYYSNSSNEQNTNSSSKSMEIFDLAAIGTGTALGFGVFLLCGHVAHFQAGPSVIVSIVITTLIGVFVGCCYSELSARISRAESSYAYSYILIGELVAFIIAWTLILECVIGVACMLKGISLFINTITDNAMQSSFLDVAPMNWSALSDYFDFFTFALGILLAIVFAVGLKRSILVANLCFIVTLSVIIYIIITGIFKADAKNWRIVPKNPDYGEGGFVPFGVNGIFTGSATFMFIFIGFESIITFRRMGKDTQKFTNIAFVITLLVTLCAVMGVGMILTFMWPYHDFAITNMPDVFEQLGWHVAKWIVAITGIICLAICVFETIYLLRNILVSLSKDSLILQPAKNNNTILRTPEFILFWAIFFIGLIASLFELKLLIDMLSIGVLFAFVMVSACIIILRYSDFDNRLPRSSIDVKTNFFVDLFNGYRKETPSSTSMEIVNGMTFIFCLLCLGLSILIQTSANQIMNSVAWALALLGIFLFFMLLIQLIVMLQPKYDVAMRIKIPLVPFLPSISIFVNIYLITCLDMSAWIRFAAWIIIGFALYIATICLEEPTHKSAMCRRLENDKQDSNGQITSNSIEPRTLDLTKTMDENGNNFVNDVNQDYSFETQKEENHVETLYAKEKTSYRFSQDSLNSRLSTEYTTEFTEIHEKITIKYTENLDMILPATDYNDDDATTDPQTESTANLAQIEHQISTDSSTVEKETRKVLDILDDVLNVEESAMSPMVESRSLQFSSISTGSPTSNASTAQLVMAVVHRNNELDEIGKVDKISTKDSDSLVILREPEPAGPIMSINEFLAEKDDQLAKKGREPVMSFVEFLNETASPEVEKYNNEFLTETIDKAPGSDNEIDDKDDNQFKLQLSDIINQKANFYKFEEFVEKEKEAAKSEPNKLRHSKSEPDFLKYITRNRSNEKLGKQISEISPDKNGDIPAPPKFDPVLYKSIGARHKSVRESIKTMDGVPAIPIKGSNKVNVFPIPLKKVKPKPLTLALEVNTSNDGEEPPLGIAAIRSKLEEILKRGPLSAYNPRPKSTTTLDASKPTAILKSTLSSENNVYNSNSNTSDSHKQDEVVQRRSIIRFTGTDTVSKQKLLFQDVLKSINPDTKPSDVKHTH